MNIDHRGSRGRASGYFLAGVFAVITSAASTSALAADPFQQNERLGRGVNIMGWDPVWQDPDRGNFKDQHFKLLHEAGFSHLRLNLHPLRDGKPDAEGKLRRSFSRRSIGPSTGRWPTS